MFDTLKQRHAQRAGQEPGVLPALAYGVASASLGQLAAFPLETVSRRLQMQSGPLAGSNFLQMLRQIVHEEGAGALYRYGYTFCLCGEHSPGLAFHELSYAGLL